MSRPLSSASDLADLDEEIALQEALYESLADQAGFEEQRRDITHRLESLHRQRQKMQQPLPHWGSVNHHHYPGDRRSNSNTGNPSSSNRPEYDGSFASDLLDTTMTLPSRKRPRNDFDDEFDTLTVPGIKSLRTPTSRTASPARSIDSFGTDLSDDPALKHLFGRDYKEEKRNTAQYLKELERKKRQEAEDAAYARQLEQKWGAAYQMDTNEPHQMTTPSGSYTQSFLRPDMSSFQKPTAMEPEVSVKPENRYRLPVINTPQSGVSTPDSDGSGLVEISSRDWTNRFGSGQQYPQAPVNGNPFKSGPNMPGTFPSVGNTFASVPGNSVYGDNSYNSSLYNSSASSFGYAFEMLADHSSMDGPALGSVRMPFDLDYYPVSSSLSHADPEQTQAEIKDLLKHIRPDDELTPEQLAEIQPEGLTVNLMPHQRKGYAWMKSMEDGTNKGGILADDMGLGKTVQALALIVGRPALDNAGNRLQRPTLIVAPVALMQQWEREIKKMVHKSHHLNVLILHGSNRNASWSEIKAYDVVLTTYGLLASDLKRKALWDKHVKLVPDARPTPQQQCPVLGDRSKFHRIILDEAQNIKNKSTKAANAACHVQADYRWCLSGTPMQNSVDEIYSLIKFCRIRPYHDFDRFSRDIGRPLKARHIQYSKEKAMQQLQALLRAVLLRRTKKSEIDGQPIIQLPEKYTNEDRAVFTKDELDFYKALETQAQIQFNRFLKNGTVGRHYSHALVLLLRLRQCCCSPQLVTNAKDFLVNGALQDLDYVENAKLIPKNVIKRLSDLEAFECPICMDAVENPVIFNPCGHSLCQECLSTMVDKAMADNASSYKVTCPHCRTEIDTNKVTDHESFLRVHFPGRPGVKPLVEEDEEGDGDGDDDDHGDMGDITDSDDSDDDDDDDDDDGEDLKDFVVPDDDDAVEYDSDASESAQQRSIKTAVSDEDDARGPMSSPLKSSVKLNGESKGKGRTKGDDKKKKKKKGKAKPDIKTLAQLRVEGLRNKAAKKKYLRRLGRGFQSSTKIEKTLQILRDIKARGEGEKTIIFSSFTSFLDLLEVAMNRDEDDFNTYTRYDGSMSAKDRNEAVIRFTDDARCRAVLVSLKAGNAGLNLTAANHVIILDPFWNPFVEYQAADRCYRIGQTRDVTIHRVLIGEGDEDGNPIDVPADSMREFTVEDRILALQEKKKDLVETALDETAMGNIGRLGVRELGYLFGVNSINE